MNGNPALDGAFGEPVSRGGLRHQVTARLLTAVFLGRFESGQRLVVQHLAETLSVSPTPVRESLVELAAMGIVELLPNRGAVVLPFGPEQVREISQVRRVLEVEADLRCASGRIDDWSSSTRVWATAWSASPRCPRETSATATPGRWTIACTP